MWNNWHFPQPSWALRLRHSQRGEVSIDRIESILTVQPKIQDATDAIALPLSQVQGRLTARDLTFTYPIVGNGGKPVEPALNRISFVIEPQETIAIVGPIGSGKSTLANALAPAAGNCPQAIISGQI
ncbi:ATP-binding cassette domain-containing protein [Kovacikia minuta]|uniref:ATP-binding cassette domain-containing protein n=1 Tax=Kovacikia minuta TaxID=2931930 RepID=UPI0036F3E23C